MKGRKFQKNLTALLISKFEEIDVTISSLLLGFKKLSEEIIVHESRISRLESAMEDVRKELTLTQSGLAGTMIKAHKLKRQLRHTNSKFDHIYAKVIVWRNDVLELQKQLAALRENDTNNAQEKEASPTDAPGTVTGNIAA
ncbi:hypothetical protein [Chitinophaga rhizophila]|uniref:Uncharacterized protein n=1 Tax=Chitinophaga rhizophila TaxID=2866212 RepID=A0ABS7GI19_9BACT|nr:hypothetical protein [Chitinophaga rhizophila]MBW8686956.1 hypothetical protein [Chitinophaga rhizophila]